MRARPNSIEVAITEAAIRVLTRRAAVLRDRAASLATTTTDSRGRPVTVNSPEGCTMCRTAEMLLECAADLGGTQ